MQEKKRGRRKGKKHKRKKKSTNYIDLNQILIQKQSVTSYLWIVKETGTLTEYMIILRTYCYFSCDNDIVIVFL